ncbi:MAG: hypothetical protein GTN74_10205 [Proteobacteria bacterium]|nr:hypothetical protein [Pseudomonadota bacterium]NIS70481.1 hypothetical protein [Pseudomonadota bacterium]
MHQSCADTLVTEEPDERIAHVRLCVQERQACSAGVSPVGVRARSPVAWMAGRRKTKSLESIDKAICGDGERVTGP